MFEENFTLFSCANLDRNFYLKKNPTMYNTPVSSYDEVTSLCRCSSVSEARKAFVYVNGGTDAAYDTYM